MQNFYWAPYKGELDLSELVPFLNNLSADNYHLVDLPYRFSSPRMQEGRYSSIWRLATGEIVGLAAWQYYWAMFDYFVLPGAHQDAVEQAIYSWFDEQMREMDRERGYPLPYWIELSEQDQRRKRLLQEHGFHMDEDYHHVRLRHSLADVASTPAPEGFTIRSLAGESEVAAYVEVHRAAFESTSMTTDWRSRTLRTPQYRPELDLVAVAENGELAGCCIGWLNQTHQIGQVEPLCIHPRYHRRGLGRALLLELLRRFQALHARYVLVEPESHIRPAVETYLAVGFQEVDKLLLKGKSF